MTWRILISAPYMRSVSDQYRPLVDQSAPGLEVVVPPVRERLSEEDMLSLDNCLLAPHNATSSPLAHQRVHENTIRNLLHHLRQKMGTGAS